MNLGRTIATCLLYGGVGSTGYLLINIVVIGLFSLLGTVDIRWALLPSYYLAAAMGGALAMALSLYFEGHP